MSQTVKSVLDKLNFDEPKVVNTKAGKRVVSNASPTPEFWTAWREHKQELKESGISVSKDKQGNWQVSRWSMPNEEERTETLELSRAKDLDVEIPVPAGLDYMGFQKAGIWFAKDKDTLIADSMGLGKAQIHGTKVYTPNGFTTIEQLKVGDYVFGRDGKPTEVTGVFPQGLREAYKVTFNDGYSLTVDGEHLWYVETPSQARSGSEGLVLTTKQMLDPEGVVYRNGIGHNDDKTYRVSTFYKQGNGNNKWAIPVVEPVEFEQREVPIDPYLLGVMLGDGSINARGRVSFQIPDHKLPMVGKAPYCVNERGLNVVYYNEYQQALTSLGLAGKRSWEKFVPDVYKYNSEEVRLAVLRGLMDTDGHPQKNHATEFSTSSKQLCDDLVEIVQSLGGIARVRERVPTYSYKGDNLEGRVAYRVNVKLIQNPFKHRASEYVVPTKYLPNRYISNIEKLDGLHEATCISVAAPDKLYVAEHFIVTHNTVQAIGVLNMHDEYQNVLVICPASLRLNWVKEINKWMVKPRTIGYVERNDYPENTDIVVINYDVVERHLDKINSRDWDLLIIDESHYLKNPKAKRTKAILGDGKEQDGIQAKHKLFLTGTPILNRPIEIFPLINALDPENWPKFWPFGLRYCNGHRNSFGWDFSGASNLPELQDRLRSTIMVRRLKEEVLTELPPKRRQVIELPADAQVKKLLKQENAAWEKNEAVIEELRLAVELSKVNGTEAEYREAVKSLNAGIEASFTEMAKLRQEIAIAKVPYVVEHVKDIAETGEKVVIFAHHKSVVAAIKEALGDEAVVLVGDTKLEDRQAAVDSFQTDPNTKYFIGSIKAAGVGITLVASSHVVFAELDWVPGNLSQAEDRCARIGQKNSVLVQHLVLEGSLDVRMAQSVIDKQEIIDRALDDEVDMVPETDLDSIKLPAFKEVEKEAKETKFTEAQKQELLEKLRILASYDTDRAAARNDMGFNRFDTRLGHSLASQDRLTDKQSVLAARLVNKYRRQLDG